VTVHERIQLTTTIGYTVSAEGILIVLAILFVIACAIDLLNVLKSSYSHNNNLMSPQLVQIRGSNSIETASVTNTVRL
jgi:hypothetical protein